MNDWLASLAVRLRAGRPVVRVTVSAVRGSAPREAGTSMLVCGETATPAKSATAIAAASWIAQGGAARGADDLRNAGTIGGGNLEWKAIAVAEQMLAQAAPARMDRFTLGASLGQCGGGAVELWFERYDAGDLAFVEDALARRAVGPATLTMLITSGKGGARSAQAKLPRRSLQCAVPPSTPRFARIREGPDAVRIVERIDPDGMPLLLFGAGHVGTALVQVLGGLPLRITWIDSREEQFSARLRELPDNVTPLLSDESADEVEFAPGGACYLVITHSHVLDEAICRAILRRGDFAWAGLIGSATKAASFRGRWERLGHASEDIARITCPIGIPGIASKHPAAIALSVAAQLQQVIEARAAAIDAVIDRLPARAVKSQVADGQSVLPAILRDAPAHAAPRPH